jgi:type IV pilus assembly protein PilF
MSAATRLMFAMAAVLLMAACVHSNPARPIKKENAAQYNMQLGIAYLHQGNLPLAKEKLDRAMSEGPREPAVHSAMALLYDRLDKPREADEEFRTALRLGPEDPDILNNYAIYLCRVGRTDEGVKNFLEAAHNGLYRTPETAYTNAGVCLRAGNKLDLAARQFENALAVRPNYGEAAYQLVDLEYTQHDLAAARQQLDKYLGAFDATPDLLLIGVRVTRAQGDRLAAERLARKLRLDFSSTDQARALAELDRNAG